MAVPGGNTHTIASLMPDITAALQGRSDIADIAPLMVKRSLQELTNSTCFEELRRTGPTVQLTIGLSTYPVSMFLNSGDDYSSPESFNIYVDYPDNTVVGALDYKTVKGIESMISPATMGVPSRFTRYGGSFLIGPVPQSQYSAFLRYQVKHPFPADDAALLNTPLFISTDWEEIIAYSAAMRIARAKRWSDQYQELHDALYGDPEFMQTQGKAGRPGLLSARMTQQERDQRFNTRQVSIVTSRYNAR